MMSDHSDNVSLALQFFFSLALRPEAKANALLSVIGFTQNNASDSDIMVNDHPSHLSPAPTFHQAYTRGV